MENFQWNEEKVKEFLNDDYRETELTEVSVVFDGKNYVVFYFHVYSTYD